MKNEKNLSKKTIYIAPNLEVVDIELEQNILQASGSAETQQLSDFDWDDW